MNRKTILISGGHGLLGSEFASFLSKDENNTIIILDLSIKKLNKLSKNSYFYDIDITDETDVKKTIRNVYERFGIDILINCAAYNEQPNENINNSFETYSLDKWNKTLAVNLTGSFLLSKECIKYMLRNENEGFKGNIINVTSQLGLVSPNQKVYTNKYIKPPCYSVSASGIISLTRYLACYYGNRIKVNCLIPSMVENNQSEEFIKSAEELIPMGRMSKKEEFNSAIKFLCSEDSSYMTGQLLICDGGYTSW